MGNSSTQKGTTAASRFGGLRNTSGGGGEIVQVQGGHIVRSTGRKDRHSKVCTAKGPRDRRVRLSAHTAIQFYDVQDRLGYDRPSKAVDWLIKKAKSAIDELEELPPWTPTTGSIPIIEEDQTQQQYQLQQQQHHSIDVRQQQPPNDNNNNSSFLPSSMNSDSIADTIKSFFPMGGASTDANSSSAANIQFHHQNFQQPHLLPGSNSQNQDLRLSLQSLQDPMLLHHQNQNEQTTGLFSGTNQMGGYYNSGWSENPSNDMGRYSRLVSWNAGGDASGGGGAFVFNSPPEQQQQQQQQSLFGQTQLLFSQRGPLQSSNTPSFRAMIDPSAFSNDHHQQAASFPFHPSSMSGYGFASAGGFRVPARIQGEEEEHDGISEKPSSASSDSRH